MTASSIVLVLLLSMFTAVAMTTTSSRTGDLGNEPAIGYSEGTEKFKIHHGNGVHDTLFTLGETVKVNITSDRVKNLLQHNSLKVFDWDNNVLMDVDPAFTVADSVGPTYSYEASFDASAANGFTNDHYRIEVAIRDNSKKWFKTWDIISVGDGAATPKYIKTFSDSGYTSMDWVFNADEVVYLEVWTGGGTPDAADSRVELANYKDDADSSMLEDLTDATITMNGEYARFAYDLASDLDTKAVDMNGGWWYTIQVMLIDDQGTDLNRLWTIQIYINDRPEVVNVGATPSVVDVIGTATTTIYAHFTDSDAPNADAFTITMKAREPDDTTVVTLVDGQGNGQGGLIISDLGGGEYNATYAWDPLETRDMGLYDIAVVIVDDEQGRAEDDFGQNPDELNLINSNYNPPTIVAGNTDADPAVVSMIGAAVTTITSDFTDSDDPAAASFVVSFWIRDPNNNVLVLADGKANGGTGKYGGTVGVIRNSANDFTASIDFDPDNTVAPGEYDLYFRVVDGDGQTAVDGFSDNPNELEITSGEGDPELVDLVVSPASVDKIGANPVTLTGRFTDADDHAQNQYLITFKVRDPSGNEIEIARDVQNGEAGGFGGTLTVTKSGATYTASMDWDPEDTVLVGHYDLMMGVEDPAGNSAKDGFGNNPDELLITSSNNAPTIVAGDTWADPALVVRTGSNETIFYANFTDSDNPPVDSFKITFKVLDPDDKEILLVDEKSNGEAGEFGNTLDIRNEAGIYTASIAWDPVDTATLGKYDLFFSVYDGFHDIGQDPFANNEDELTITGSHEPPTLTVGNVRAVPNSVNREGTDFTTIFSEFKDPNFDNLNDFSVTFKVKDEKENELVLADGNMNGEIAESGTAVMVTRSDDVFTASIHWDPPDSALTGNYDLYFEVQNLAGASVRDEYADNLDELIVELANGTSPGNPILDPNAPGESGNDYTFIVIYSDDENDPPDEKGVIMILDGEEYVMTEMDALDTDYSDGKKYFVVKSLDPGTHTYRFTATDTTGLNASTEPESVEVAPDGTGNAAGQKDAPDGTGNAAGQKEDTSKSGTVWPILLVVAIVAVLLLLFLWMRRKKADAKDGSGQGEDAKTDADDNGPRSPKEAIPVAKKAFEKDEGGAATAQVAKPAGEGKPTEVKPAEPEIKGPTAPPKAD
jgi:hypothetical protein